jgi:hypothetical protein
VAVGDLDPRATARFRRGYDPATEQGGVPDPVAADEPEALPAEGPRRAGGVSLLVLAVLLAAAGGAAIAWTVLDPAFTVPPEHDPFAAARRVALAAPGPLAVAVVAAMGAGLLSDALPGRAAVAAAGVVGVGLIVAVARTAGEAARLMSLTANGPVSSGGIPLPEPAFATFFQRIRLLGVLEDVLPWLVLAAALAVAVAVLVTGRLLSTRRLA